MASSGPNYAGASGTNSWTNPANAVGSGETTCATTSTAISGFWNTFGFSLPANAVIKGILVETKVSKTVTQAATVAVVIGKNESTLGTEKAAQTLTNVACGASQPILSWGGSSDLWGLSWLYSDVNNAAFCVRVRSVEARAKALNWIRVTVYYAAQYEISLSETSISVGDSLLKQPQKPLLESTITILAETVARTIQRILAEASISIPDDTLAKSIFKNISLNEDSISILAETLSRNISRILSEASISIPAETISKLVSKVLSEESILILDENLIRFAIFSRSLSEPTVQVLAEALTRQIERSLNEATISLSDSLLKQIQKELSESYISVLSENLARELSRSLSEASLLMSDSLIKEVTKPLEESIITVNDNLEKQVDRILVEATATIMEETLATEINRILFEESILIPDETLIRNVILMKSLSESALSISDEIKNEIQRFLTEPSISFLDALTEMIERNLLEASLSFNDDVAIQYIPSGGAHLFELIFNDIALSISDSLVREVNLALIESPLLFSDQIQAAKITPITRPIFSISGYLESLMNPQEESKSIAQYLEDKD